MTENTKDTAELVSAYRCKKCGRLYEYNVNEDKVHISLDYIQNIVFKIFVLWILYWTIKWLIFS